MKNEEIIQSILRAYTETRRNARNKLKAPPPVDAQGYNKDLYVRNKHFYQDHPEWVARIRNAMHLFIARDAQYPLTRLLKLRHFIYATDGTCAIRTLMGTIGTKEVRSIRSFNYNPPAGATPVPDLSAAFFYPKPNRPCKFHIPIGTLFHKLQNIPYEPIYQACNACAGTGYVKCLCCNHTNPCVVCDATGLSKHYQIGVIPKYDSWLEFTHEEQRANAPESPIFTFRAKIWGRHGEILYKAMETLTAEKIRIISITPNAIRIRFVIPSFPGHPILLPTVVLFHQKQTQPFGIGLPPATLAILNSRSSKK